MISSLQYTGEVISSASVMVTPELACLIEELLAPRIEELHKLISTEMVIDLSQLEAGDDWWPDYCLTSHFHYMTEMNGFMYLAQNSMKNVDKDLETIRNKFREFVLDILNADQGSIQTLKRYGLVYGLIKDMIILIYWVREHCKEMLTERKEHQDLATATMDTKDRINLKIFDERCFYQLISRMSNLQLFLEDFCALFKETHVQSGTAQPTNASFS